MAFNDFYWAPPAGSDGRASTANNWLRNDSLTAGRHTLPPGPGSRTFFDGDLSSADCWFDALAGTTGGGPPPPGGYPDPDWLGGLLVRDEYAGVVDMDLSLRVGEVLMASGPAAIIQTDPSHTSVVTAPHGGTLTVTGSLLWTGGSLNAGPSATHAAYINLAPGATGVAEPSFTMPGVNGTVTLGSVLTLKGNTSALGSTLDVLEGTFKLLNNDASFVVENNSTISLKAPVPQTPTIPGKIVIDGEAKTSPIKEALIIKEGGKGVIKAKQRPANNDDYAKVLFTGAGSTLRNSGELIIRDRSWLIFDESDEQRLGGLIQNSGDAPLDPDGPPPTQNQKTEIEAGCRITCRGLSAVSIITGSLVMTEVSGEAVQPDIRIQGSLAAGVPYALRIYGAAKIQVPEERRKPITLRIDGLLDWAGEIELYADHTAYKNDQVFASGRIVVEKAPPPPLIPPVIPALAVDAKLTVKWFDATQGEPVSTEGVWTLVQSTYSPPEGTQGPPQLPISATPKFVHPPDVNSSRATIGMTPDSDKIQMKLEPAD